MRADEIRKHMDVAVSAVKEDEITRALWEIAYQLAKMNERETNLNLQRFGIVEKEKRDAR